MAGVELATAYVSLTTSAQGIQQSIAQQLGGAGNAAAAAGEDAGKRMGSSFASNVKAIAGTLAGVFAVKELYDFGKESFESLQRIERLNAQTAATIASTGSAAQVTAKHVEDLTGNLENLTGTEAESIRTGANLLLTFTNIQNGVGEGNDIFDQAVVAVTDMSRALDKSGEAFIDTSSAALQLGKALNDPIKGVSALQEVGVSFTEAQKDQIEAMVNAGDIAGAQGVILAELTKEFGGAGEAFAKTSAGQFALAGQALGTLGETIMSFLLPPLTSLATWGAGALNGLAVKAEAIGPAMEPIIRIGRQVMDILFRGDYTGGLGGEDSQLVATLFAIRDALVSAWQIGGQVLGELRAAFVAAWPEIQARVAAAVAVIAPAALGLFHAIQAAVPDVIAGFRNLAEFLAPILAQFSVLGPVVTALVAGALAVLAAILPPIASAFASVTGWMNENRGAMAAIGIVIATILVPLFLTMAARATASAAAQVTAWVVTRATAVKSAAAQLIASYRVVAGWVASAAAAVASGATTVYIWGLYAAQAVKGAAAHALSAARVVAGWVLMGVQSLLNAAKVAAAWLISMGPIALVIAAVVGLVVVIVKNWDAIRDAIVGAATFVLDWLKGNWPLILAIITGPFGLVVLAIVKYWDEIMAGVTAVKDWISAKFNEAVSFLSGIPGRVSSAVSGIWDSITGAVDTAKQWVSDRFDDIVALVKGLPERVKEVGSGIFNAIGDGAKAIFNKVAGWWNDSVGSLSFEVPGWVPGLGGKGFSMPKIPTAKALGGSVEAGNVYRINERGQELFAPGVDGRMYTAWESQKILGGGRGDTNVNVHEVANDPVATGMAVARRIEMAGAA